MDALAVLHTYEEFQGFTPAEAALIQAMLSMVWLIFLIGILGIAERVLFAMAVYSDARAKNNSESLMWALLVGFLGLIPGIIYLCVRNSSSGAAMCPNCGFYHKSTDFTCPKCGAPNPTPNQFNNPYIEQQAHRAKILLIVAVVIVIVEILLGILLGASLSSSILTFLQNEAY